MWGCLQVSYCGKNCQRKDWNYHRLLFETIEQNKLLDNFSSSGQGNGGDAGVYISHITPKEKERISKLVGSKCIVTVIMNKIKVVALFGTGAQVSIISTHQLEEYFPGIQIQDIQDLFTGGKDLEQIMANGSKTPL